VILSPQQASTNIWDCSLPRQIPVLVLDPGLRATLGGMRHFQAPVDDLNAWTQTPHTVVIAENKQIAHALEDEYLPDTVVMHSMGFHTNLYARVTWVRDAPNVVYWGDLDTFGLEALDRLRANGVAAESILTDTATLARFRHLTATSGDPTPRPVPNLNESEQELYALLVEHFTSHREGLVLEQERIPWDVALTAIREAVNE
jgi:hypothetical protein